MPEWDRLAMQRWLSGECWLQTVKEKQSHYHNGRVVGDRLHGGQASRDPWRQSGACGTRTKNITRAFAEFADVPTDVTKPGDAKRMVDQTLVKLGRIDVLINCAAQAMFATVENIPVDQYRELLELNVIAPLNLMQLVIPHMRTQGGGTILNISSLSSKKFIPNIAGYASTKYALNALSHRACRVSERSPSAGTGTGSGNATRRGASVRSHGGGRRQRRLPEQNRAQFVLPHPQALPRNSAVTSPECSRAFRVQYP